MGGILQYKWEAYCRVSLSSELRSQESTAIHVGGVLPYKLEVYCRTFSTSCRGWDFRNIAHIKLHAGWFLNRTRGSFSTRVFLIKYKGLFCGNPTERGGKFNTKFLAARQFISPTQTPWFSAASEGLRDRKKYNRSGIYTVNCKWTYIIMKT